MARKNRELNNPFDENSKQPGTTLAEQSKPRIVEPGEGSTEEVGSTPADETPTNNTNTGLTVKDATNDLIDMFNKKQSKLTVEETHKRVTFLLDRDLNDRLNALAEGKKGFKTLFLNKAIKTLLDELELDQ
ncbi:hypothetical protein ACQVSN_26970 [Bacillus mobilis]|uniref:hypothetical protein n=1 Tax=Bacillus mobilis TaxID=2026190 RepID=UPI003D646B44